MPGSPPATGHADTERTALEQVIDQAPGDTRGAGTPGGAGHASRGNPIVRPSCAAARPTSIGPRNGTLRLLEPDKTITQFTELAGLAEKLGRGFEARGWWFLASRHQPSAAATSAVERLGPPRPDPHLPAGKTLAFHLGDVAGLPVDRTPLISGRRPAHGVASVSADAGLGRRHRHRPSSAMTRRPPGLRFVFDNGRSPLRQLPETTAGGVGLLDYDGDGWLDVYVVQGGAFPPDPGRPPTGDRLFRNRGDGTFRRCHRTVRHRRG